MNHRTEQNDGVYRLIGSKFITENYRSNFIKHSAEDERVDGDTIVLYSSSSGDDIHMNDLRRRLDIRT